MMKKVFYVAAIIMLAFVFLCAYHLRYKMPGYDNLTRKEDLITRQYAP